MRKNITCKECNETCKVNIICDECGKDLEYVSYILDNGYGSKFDGTKYDFCSLKCLHEFVYSEYLNEVREKENQ